MPWACTRSSTSLALLPWTFASCTTATSACSDILLGSRNEECTSRFEASGSEGPSSPAESLGPVAVAVPMGGAVVAPFVPRRPDLRLDLEFHETL